MSDYDARTTATEAETWVEWLMDRMARPRPYHPPVMLVSADGYAQVERFLADHEQRRQAARTAVIDRIAARGARYGLHVTRIDQWWVEMESYRLACDGAAPKRACTARRPTP